MYYEEQTPSDIPEEAINSYERLSKTLTSLQPDHPGAVL